MQRSYLGIIYELFAAAEHDQQGRMDILDMLNYDESFFTIIRAN